MTNLTIVDRRDAFDAAPASLSVTDPYGRLLFANDAFYELFGFEPSGAVDVGMLTRSDDQDWTLSYLTQLNTGTIDRFETVKRFTRHDGSEFDGHVSLRAMRRSGHCVAIIGHVSPVDIRPRVDDNRTRRLLQHAAGTLTLVDADGRVVETSGRYRATLGYPPEFWEDRTILDLLLPEDLERVSALRDEILQAPEATVTGDFYVQAANRGVECLEVTAVNMLHDPDLNGIVLSTRNVTAERNTTRSIQRLHDEAIAEADRRSRLLATVSHELRNPLHAMSGLAELLSSDPTLGQLARDLATSLHRQLIHLASVTDDLLDTARLDVGQFELRFSGVELRTVVDDAVRTARASADGRIDIDMRVSDDAPHVITTDPARLQQIIGNLVGNAVKFTEDGSISVEVTANDTNIVITVADTGTGIPHGDLERIFRPFTTASTSGDRRGAGLGLAIVQRLVEALGGTISARSEVGVGSTFVVELPIRAGLPANPRTEPSLPDAPALRRARVLVVEDTPVNQQLARHQLDRLEMDATIADSAEIALSLLDQQTFDAILMDHQLPGMNGRDATRELRRRGITTPVIGITASSTAADERACLDAGMDHFLPKPVGLDALRTTLDAVLRSPRPPDVAPDAANTTTAPFATTELDALVGDLGDREIVADLVMTFLGELDARRIAISGADHVTAARQAHTLKSSAALLGAHALAAACAAVEHDPDAQRNLTPLIDSTRADLQAWLDNQPTAQGGVQ